MTIKPWLSRSFLQKMTWSNARDYPPKRKKAWLSDNFAAMEEIHYEHTDKPWELPNDPLPPDPSIPQTAAEGEADPCFGPRVLWVNATPPSVDCDTGGGFTLLISPDFKCVELTQAFYSATGPKIVDQLGNTLQHPTNADDIVGALELEKGCEGGEGFITIWVTDCLCGGSSSVNIDLNSCDIVCGGEAIDCDSSPCAEVNSNDVKTYELTGSEGAVVWSVTGIGASIEQTGKLTTNGACGTLTVTATTVCCGAFQLKIRVVNSGFWDTTLRELTCVGNTVNPQEECIFSDAWRYTNWQGTGCVNPCNGGDKGQVVRDPWECPP